MGVVDVCLYNGNICNLEDMSILGELPKEDPTTIYEHLRAIKQEYNIKFAIIGFNQPLRNAVYSAFPNASIVIHPLDVIIMITNYLEHLEPINESNQEIAAGIENEQLKIYEIGCQGIYDNSDKNQAMDYYRQWQGNVPLGIKSFHNVIRTIDYYYEEVFNYFDFKNIFKDKSLIR